MRGAGPHYLTPTSARCARGLPAHRRPSTLLAAAPGGRSRRGALIGGRRRANARAWASKALEVALLPWMATQEPRVVTTVPPMV